ncbi:phage tail protein [Streptomyces chartreusis]|uniref:phage tail protein n=1 Tax=Streptomyces chartreusis TaxID=1969 RepID=UPI0033F38F18
MRAAVTGLRTPYPLISLLPSVYQDDSFTHRFTAGLDDVVAPIINTLDCLDAYLDPKLAPKDFVTWLASVVGAELQEGWPLVRRRAVTSNTVAAHKARGTAAGLTARIFQATGVNVEIDDPGGVVTSRAPNSEYPPSGNTVLVIRIAPQDETDVDPADLDVLIRDCLPAYLPYRMEVTP